jgi:hypothetical protein
MAHLYSIYFDVTDYKIETPQITFSNKTRLKEIKEKFPNSYAHRNFLPNYWHAEGFDMIHLSDDLPNIRKTNPNQIDLRFKNGKLIGMEYLWHPEYTEEEWDVHQKRLDSIKAEYDKNSS